MGYPTYETASPERHTNKQIALMVAAQTAQHRYQSVNQNEPERIIAVAEKLLDWLEGRESRR